MNVKRLLVFLIPAVIVLAFIAYILTINLVFIFTNELDVETTFTNNTFEVQNGETIQLKFATSVNAPNTCTTTCSFVLRNDVTNSIISNESKEVSSVYETTIAYLVDEKTNGELYVSYDVACQNQVSTLCTSSQETYYETSFISITHNLTKEQHKQKDNVESMLQSFLITFSLLETFEEETQYYLEKIPFVQEGQDITTSLRQSITRRDYLLGQFESFQTNWENSNYFDISQPELDAMNSALYSLEEDFFNQKNSSWITLQEVNNNIEIMNEISKYEDELRYLEESQDAQSLQEFVAHSREELSVVHEKLSQQQNLSIISLSQEINQLKDLIASYVSNYNVIESTAIQQIAEKTTLWVPVPSASIEQSCEYINSSISQIQEHDAQANLELNTNYSQELQNNSFLQQLNAYALALYTNQSFNDTTYPYSDIATYHPNWTRDLTQLRDRYCFNVSPTNLTNIPLINMSIPFKEVAIPELPEIQKQCCVYGECKTCTDEPRYPIILVHGHALTSVTSAEAALHSFSKIQRGLESSGYMNVGELNDYPATSWQHVHAPLSIRVSYYFLPVYDIGKYQFYTKKYESIETYAIRLKEIIEDVKMKTNQDKVIILAHSMGGLVTRQYLALFGEDSVEKVILVGTPNNGVTGASEKLCSLTGANKECAEMAQGSIFLKRLSTFTPTKTQMYVIAGVGCPKGGEEGDGVVSLKSVQLDYAQNFIINGTCPDALQSDLHRDLIDPQIYPEVLDIIKDIIVS